jgi:hypothetical protein
MRWSWGTIGGRSGCRSWKSSLRNRSDSVSREIDKRAATQRTSDGERIFKFDTQMRIGIPLALIASLVSVTRAWCQNQPEVSTREAPVTFTSRLNLVSVPVVARDREGRPIGNLKQENFQLFDKGKLQIVTRFSIEKSERPAMVTGLPRGTIRDNRNIKTHAAGSLRRLSFR